MDILFPIFGMVAITAATLFRLAYLRFAAAANREVDVRYYRVYQGEGEPERVAAASRHLVNLFETPVLFYVAAILVYITETTSPAIVTIAWAYVALRAVHCWIHLGTNVVIWRFRVFVMSFAVLLVMWVMLAIRLLAQ
jgi:hypothetical protein